MKRLAASVCILALTVSTVPAQERVDLDMVTRIRLEGFTNSKVMETASELMDRIGPRLTGSPQMKEANEWTKERLSGWGLANARLESWGPFGRGWTWEGCSVRMIAPDKTQLVAIPEAWTAGTSGPIRGAAARLNIKEVSELEGLKGRFGGKIVFFGEARDIGLRQKPDSHRYDEEELEAEFLYQMPGGPPRYNRAEYAKRREIRKAVNKFLDEEKALAIVSPGRGDMGTFNVQGGGTWKKGDPQGLPSLSMEPEHFGRVARLLDRSVPVEIEMDVQARFIEEDLMQWNTIAEIPGSDKKDEVVMVGAHLDSWHGATGATDNGAGSVVAMEAMRILKAVGVEAPAHDPHRALERRGAGPVRIARLRLAALRVAAGAFARRKGKALLPPQEDRPADGQAGAREAVRVFQPRQRQRERSAASIARTTPRSHRSSGNGSSLSPTSGRRS